MTLYRWAGCLILKFKQYIFLGFLRLRDHLGDHLKDAVVDRRIILIWIFREWDMGAWTGSIWLRIGVGSGHL